MESEQTLDRERHLAGLKFGMGLFLAIQTMPFITLFTARYEIDGFYIAPTLSQWLGATEAVLMALSAWCALSGLNDIRRNRLLEMQKNLKVAVVFGLGYLAVLAYQWSQFFTPVHTRYGEFFYTMTGTAGFYTLAGLVVMVAITVRSGRAHFNSDNYWDVQAATWFWVFQAVATLATWVYLYFI